MSLLQWLQKFSWQMKTGGSNLYYLNHIRNHKIQFFHVIYGFMLCAANAYLYVNHDYEAYENEGLTLLVSISSFHVIQKTLFLEKLFIIIDEQFILNLI